MMTPIPLMMYTDSLTKARVRNPGGPDGRIKLEEGGVDFGWQLGLMYEVNKGTRIGGSFDTHYALVLDTQIIKRF